MHYSSHVLLKEKIVIKSKEMILKEFYCFVNLSYLG